MSNSSSGGGFVGQLYLQALQEIIRAINGITTSFLNSIRGAPLSVRGNATNATTTLADIIGTSDQVLRVNTAGNALAFGTVNTGGITNNAATYAKMQQGAGLSVVGAAGNAAANNADIAGTAAQVLRVNDAGTALGFGAIDLAQSAAATGVLQAASFPALTGDVTTSSGALATTIAANAVSNAKFRQGAALSVVGVAGNAAANVGDIAGTAAQVLRVNDAGTALAFGAIDVSQAAAVTGTLPGANGGTGANKTNFIRIDRNAVNQTRIAQSTFTKVQFNRIITDVDGVFDATTNFRYTPNVAGKFLVTGALAVLSASSNLTRAVGAIYKNGSELFRTQDTIILNAAGLSQYNCPFSGIIDMNGTIDFIEIFTFITSNGGLADGIVAGSIVNTYLTAQRIGP